MGTVESEARAGLTVHPNTLVILAYMLMVVLVGANPVAVRFTVAELPPFWGAGLRFAAAALIFWLAVAARRSALPRGRALTGALLYGLLNFGMSYAFIYWGIRSLTAGLTQVILALVPLLTFFAAFIHGLEPFRWRGLFGALLAVAGIAWAFLDGGHAGAPLPALLSIIASAACIAEATVTIKLFPRPDPFAANAVGMTAGAGILLALSFLGREPRPLPHLAATWASMAYLVFFGSVVVFYLFLYILSHWTASATSYQFVMFPFVTLLVAGWLAGETIGIGFAVGAVLVLAGVWLGAFSAQRATTS